MGCVLELLFEITVEGMLELIGHIYIKLMQLIVPNKTVSDKTKKYLKKVVTKVSALLAIVLIIGLIFLVQEDALLKTIGQCMTYIPLSIIVLQVLLGIVLKVIDFCKK
ncbi:MAG: hypothetical protein IJN04_05195 [Clostridia bacterium]|nr:hypothetical protein [Clostridia bacterium]